MKKIIGVLLIYCILLLPCQAISHTDIDVTMNQVPLSTQLKKYYCGYEYKITNTSKSKINIVNAQIINGNDGNVAYTTTMNNEPSAMARTWIIAGPVGLFTLGIGWAVGLLATPVVAIVTNKNKKKTQTESIAYSNIITLGILNAGESTQVSTLVPIGSKPQVKLTVQDIKTNQLEMLTY